MERKRCTAEGEENREGTATDRERGCTGKIRKICSNQAQERTYVSTPGRTTVGHPQGGDRRMERGLCIRRGKWQQKVESDHTLGRGGRMYGGQPLEPAWTLLVETGRVDPLKGRCEGM